MTKIGYPKWAAVTRNSVGGGRGQSKISLNTYFIALIFETCNYIIYSIINAYLKSSLTILLIFQFLKIIQVLMDKRTMK